MFDIGKLFDFSYRSLFRAIVSVPPLNLHQSSATVTHTNLKSVFFSAPFLPSEHKAYCMTQNKLQKQKLSHFEMDH